MTIPRSLRISLRGLPAPVRAVYFGTIGFAVTLMLVAIWAGLLLVMPVLLLLLGSFLYTAPYILGRRWRPKPTPPTRRPVVRRRRA